ncbi:hypothetical protein RYH80_17225 [Halobaculum sp. MBLA0147]|uniref:hypothetical protein n=1 Tax=Halobaculum sp. MBLA0147 TaxID=3079934 RepID=UPI00352689B6
MGQRTLGGDDLGPLREAYLERVEDRLPARARAAGDWPIHEDHCFARVVLDNVFGDEWYAHVDGSPAYERLSRAELERAVDIADRMLSEGRPAVIELNEKSLRWRGER